jgi:NAD(P)-dependent dehydrogenase (short-subunit alcohol dehydrogenase family)
MEPLDLSYAVLFLASDEAPYVTGSNYRSTQGNTLKP